MRPLGGALSNEMGGRMRLTERWRRLAGFCALIAALTFAVAACGGGDDEGKGGGTTTAASGGGAERTFPEFKIAFDNGIDYLDPGLSYTVQGWSVLWISQLPLLTYKHVNGPDGATIIPALAEDLPEISEDGLTYKFKLRKGWKYSDGTPIKASDFKYTVKRLFQVDSPGVGFFTNIKGAETFAKTKKGDISGITTNDQTGDITIKLSQPQGDFLNVIATEFGALVPPSVPAKDQSTKGIPASGPYTIQKYVPNRTVTMVRNPNYQELDGIPKGNPDKITLNVIEEDSAALQSVIDGRNDYNFHPIPVDRLGEVQSKYALAQAKQLVQQSGYAGMEVTVWGNSRETLQKPAEYLTDVLKKLGFNAKLKIIDPSVYFTTIGNQRTKAQTGIANWFQDYPHPLDWFDVLLNGKRITEEHNNNYSNADVKAINAKIEALKKEPELTDDVNSQWAQVDKMVMQNALWAPVVNRQFTDFFTPQMDLADCYVNHVLYQFDYSQICKKS